jgi:flagellar assembly factor FliW
VEYDASQIVEFPSGLLGFDLEKRFVRLARPGLEPFVFLQSLDRMTLRFIGVAAEVISPGYRYSLSGEDLSVLRLPPEWTSASWSAPDDEAAGLTCLALVAFPDDGEPSANLMAPVVISHAAGRAVQSLQFDKGYSHCHPLRSRPPDGEPAC